MNMFKQLALAGAASLALATGAQGTDLYTAVPSTPMAYEESGFDWEGFYFGVQKGYWLDEGAWSFNKVIGVNFLLGDNILAGVEATGGVITDFSGLVELEGYLRGRVGLLVSDDVLIYKLGEVGWIGGTPTWALGGGIEFAATDNVSLRGEFRGIGPMGAPLEDTVASIAFLWHAN